MNELNISNEDFDYNEKEKLILCPVCNERHENNSYCQYPLEDAECHYVE